MLVSIFVVELCFLGGVASGAVGKRCPEHQIGYSLCRGFFFFLRIADSEENRRNHRFQTADIGCFFRYESGYFRVGIGSEIGYGIGYEIGYETGYEVGYGIDME